MSGHYCQCGHTASQHEIRGFRFGCYIAGCICIDYEPAPAPVADRSSWQTGPVLAALAGC